MTDLSNSAPMQKSTSQMQDVWAQFRKHKGAMLGGGFLAFITLAVLLGPYIWTMDPQKIDYRARDLRPIYTGLFNSDAKVAWIHPFGTDQLGRDGLSNMLAGGRASMAVGWAAMLLTLFIGTLIGVVAGFFRKLDGPLMRMTDLFLSLPILPLLLVAVTLFREPLSRNFGPEGGMFILIVGIIGVTSWMPTARIVRGDVLALKEREFVLAARSIGTNNNRLITRHILPNVLSPIMVSATLGLATLMPQSNTLARRGVGFPSDFPTWGKMLADAVDRMENFPERVILPGMAISLTVLSVNYLGDGLRDALDPRIRGR